MWEEYKNKDERFTSYTYRRGELRVLLHHHINHPPEEWLVTCFDVSMSRAALRSKEVEKAKREALRLVSERAKKLGALAREGLKR